MSRHSESAVGWGIMITKRSWVRTYHIVFLAGLGLFSLLSGVYEAHHSLAFAMTYPE